LLSLFQRNPVLIERIAAVLGAAPSLADHLARTPAALEGLLAPTEREGERDSERERDPARLMRARLADARALEDSIALVRRTVREEDFAISVATLEGRIDADAAGIARSALADAALASLLPRVLDDFAARFGAVRGGGMAVVLLGKAGGREMMVGSDLDLMVVYDHPASATESRGARPMPVSQWFIRAVHALVAAVTAPDAAGPMYAVDMRLRPSGNKGPVAVSLASFRRYHAHDAWTWERMALTRARLVAGPAPLRARVEAAIREALLGAGRPEKIKADASAMRARVAREFPGRLGWDVKHRAGGQMEVEFIAQTLQLAHAPAYPGVLDPTTRVALSRLRDAGLLGEADISRAAADALLAAARAAGVDAVDVAGLRTTLDALAAQARAAFIKLIGEIA
jgi:glutamate-ammonia-ligase adenylyltransferase